MYTTRGLCNAGGWTEGFLQLGKHSAYQRAISLHPRLFLFLFFFLIYFKTVPLCSPLTGLALIA